MGANTSIVDDINTPQIHQLYTKFMRECPSGLLSLYEFKTLLDLHHMDAQAETYVDRVFQTFDSNKVSLVPLLIFQHTFFRQYVICCML